MTSLSFLTGLAAYFVAGMMAARQNGKVSTGVFAGMWTGGIYGIIGFVVSIVLFFQVLLPRIINQFSASGLSTNMDTLTAGATFGGVFGAIFGIFFAVGLGAGLGALGGLVGRDISPYKAANMVPAGMPAPAPYPGQPMYPAAPYPGQPMYPAAPYPGQPMYPAAPYPGQPVYSSQPAVDEQVYIEQPAANPYQSPPQQ